MSRPNRNAQSECLNIFPINTIKKEEEKNHIGRKMVKLKMYFFFC